MGRPSPLPGLEWRNCHASLSTQEGAIVCQHGVASIVSRIVKFKVDWLWILFEFALGMAFSQHFIYSSSSLIYSLVLKRLLWTLLAGSKRSDRTVFSSKSSRCKLEVLIDCLFRRAGGREGCPFISTLLPLDGEMVCFSLAQALAQAATLTCLVIEAQTELYRTALARDVGDGLRLGNLFATRTRK